MNGDGFDDVIVDAYKADNGVGAAYVVFGTDQVGTKFYQLNALGDAGFKILGVAAGGYAGGSVSGADINGDGLEDIIIGSPQDSSNTGETFIVYGSNALSTDITTAEADTVINGIDTGDAMGGSVSNAGDINGDGYDDVIIGSVLAGTDTGEAYVLFGKAGGLDTSVDVADLATGGGNVGFLISLSTNNQNMGNVSSLGDINGDGYDDIAIGARNADPNGTNSGASYVIFGKGSAFDQVIDVDTLAGGDGSSGFRIQGPNAMALAGASTTSAGDINGDGLDDILFSALLGGGSSEGEAYVIFGSTDGFDADILSASISPEQGFKLTGIDSADGFGIPVSSAGDINGDGFDDIMVGAFGAAGVNNDSGYGNDGETYIVYGGDFFGDVNTTGTENADNLVGSSGEDQIIGAGGADVINAGAGDDTVIVDDASFAHLDGGGSLDTLVLAGAFNVDLTVVANNIINGFEHINLDNGLANTLDIDFASVLDIGEAIDHLVNESNMLVISGDANDTVNLAGNWTERAEQPEDASSQVYTVFDSDDSEASVAIQNIINGTHK